MSEVKWRSSILVNVVLTCHSIGHSCTYTAWAGVSTDTVVVQLAIEKRAALLILATCAAGVWLLHSVVVCGVPPACPLSVPVRVFVQDPAGIRN